MAHAHAGCTVSRNSDLKTPPRVEGVRTEPTSTCSWRGMFSSSFSIARPMAPATADPHRSSRTCASTRPSRSRVCPRAPALPQAPLPAPPGEQAREHHGPSLNPALPSPEPQGNWGTGPTAVPHGCSAMAATRVPVALGTESANCCRSKPTGEQRRATRRAGRSPRRWQALLPCRRPAIPATHRGL